MLNFIKAKKAESEAAGMHVFPEGKGIKTPSTGTKVC